MPELIYIPHDTNELIGLLDLENRRMYEHLETFQKWEIECTTTSLSGNKYVTGVAFWAIQEASRAGKRVLTYLQELDKRADAIIKEAEALGDTG